MLNKQLILSDPSVLAESINRANHFLVADNNLLSINYCIETIKSSATNNFTVNENYIKYNGRHNLTLKNFMMTIKNHKIFQC